MKKVLLVSGLLAQISLLFFALMTDDMKLSIISMYFLIFIGLMYYRYFNKRR